MKTLALFLVLLVALVGCSPTIQVVTLRGSNVRPATEGLIMDNDTLTLQYNFASERGLMHLTLINKLNQPLYVDWKRSSFIVGQDKLDYWYDVAAVDLYGSFSNGRYSYYSRGNLGGTISKEDMIAFIPPKTKLEKRQFVIVPEGNVPLKGQFVVEQEPSNMVDHKKPVNVNVYTYSADQSPLAFRNYLTLSTDKDFKTEFHIDTNFWASDVKVLPRDQILSRFNGSYLEDVPFKKPDSFYVPVAVQ